MKQTILCISAFVLLLVSTSTFAQTQLDPSIYDENGFVKVDESIVPTANEDADFEPPLFAESSISPESYKQGEPVSCFDYYSFGSIGINLTQDYSSYEPGDAIILRGRIENNNPYPVIGLDIKARLVKDIPAPVALRAEVMILDEFDVADNITIGANGEYEVAYSHLLPFNAPSGDYKIYFYAVEQDRFNMAGLSFTNDVVASTISFEVAGQEPEHTYLDQTNITVGGKNHNIMGFMTQHEKGSQIPVTIPLYNPETESVNMTITYDLYSWDAANPNNKIATRSEQVTVPAKSEIILTYTIEKGIEPAYYLSITSTPTNQTKDQSVHREKTISNIRLIVQDVNKTRINFITTNTYPLVEGQESQLVTCFHNTSSGTDPNISKIETILKDSKGRELARSVFEGNAPSQISAILQKFIPKTNYLNYVIESTVYASDGSVIDRVEKVYACKDINPDACPAENSPIAAMLIVLISILAVMLVVYYFFTRKTFNIERV